MRLSINTQTPLVRFTRPVETEDPETPIPLTDLVRGEDYRYTAGGVTHMLHPLLAEWRRGGQLAAVRWLSLNAADAPSLTLDGIRFDFVGLPEEHKQGYGEAKEAMWALLNTLPEAPASPEAVAASSWDSLAAYHAACADGLRRAHEEERFDVFYVHDFQQLGVAPHLPRGVPRLFHLHTPFPNRMGAAWNAFFSDAFRRYDGIIVSSESYARAIRAAGYEGPVHRVYPFIDPRAYPRAQPGEAQAFRERFDIPADRRVVINVARMDPMKGQDRMIRALPALLRQQPDAHVVLVGNGSFSSSKNGGLGLSKGQQWRQHLETLAKDLGVADHVTFTGHLAQKDVPAAYGSADVFCLPSVREGFGLAVVEAWLYELPVVVSRGAGVSELVRDRENGMVTDTEDPEALAAVLGEMLGDAAWSRDMGEEGHRTSREASMPAGRAALERILAQTVKAGVVRA